MAPPERGAPAALGMAAPRPLPRCALQLSAAGVAARPAPSTASFDDAYDADCATSPRAPGVAKAVGAGAAAVAAAVAIARVALRRAPQRARRFGGRAPASASSSSGSSGSGSDGSSSGGSGSCSESEAETEEAQAHDAPGAALDDGDEDAQPSAGYAALPQLRVAAAAATVRAQRA
jgi:hypothetical protein